MTIPGTEDSGIPRAHPEIGAQMVNGESDESERNT